VVRATLELVTAVSPQGLPADSFKLVANAAAIDFGGKSPIDPLRVDTLTVHIGVTGTVRIDVTNIVRFWTVDTIAPTTMLLRQVPEGANFAEIRFYPSSDATRGPILHLTYSPRFPFGQQ
jgi:hypothetical protein